MITAVSATLSVVPQVEPRRALLPGVARKVGLDDGRCGWSCQSVREKLSKQPASIAAQLSSQKEKEAARLALLLLLRSAVGALRSRVSTQESVHLLLEVGGLLLDVGALLLKGLAGRWRLSGRRREACLLGGRPESPQTSRQPRRWPGAAAWHEVRASLEHADVAREPLLQGRDEPVHEGSGCIHHEPPSLRAPRSATRESP